jgi:hypothetical protein
MEELLMADKCPNCGHENRGQTCPNCGHAKKTFPGWELAALILLGLPGMFPGGCGVWLIFESLKQSGPRDLSIALGAICLFVGGGVFFLTLRNFLHGRKR